MYDPNDKQFLAPQHGPTAYTIVRLMGNRVYLVAKRGIRVLKTSFGHTFHVYSRYLVIDLRYRPYVDVFRIQSVKISETSLVGHLTK